MSDDLQALEIKISAAWSKRSSPVTEWRHFGVGILEHSARTKMTR